MLHPALKDPPVVARQLSKIGPVRQFAKNALLRKTLALYKNDNWPRKTICKKCNAHQDSHNFGHYDQTGKFHIMHNNTNTKINTISNTNNIDDQVWLLRPSREASNCKLPRGSSQRFSIIDDFFIFSLIGSWWMTMFLCCALLSPSVDWSIHPERPQNCLLQGFYAEGEHVPTPEYKRR